MEFSGTVKKAQSTQPDLLAHIEHCSVDPDRINDMGGQVRVTRSATEYALYTIGDLRQETPDTIIRMSAAARSRLGTTEEFAATLSTQVMHPSYTDAQAESHSEFVERLDEAGEADGLAILAPHGGGIEPWTDDEAERVYAALSGKNVACWRCKGWKQGGGAHARWHITSTDISPASFPLLGTIYDRGYVYAVSFHGIADSSLILIGGSASVTLRTEVAASISDALVGTGITVQVAQENEENNGDDPDNIVNWITQDGEGGIQIEQSLDARTGHWQAIADAVAGVYAELL